MITIKTTSGEDFQFSFQQNLIMAHSSFISAQWNPDQVGVQVLRQQHNVSVSFTATLPKGAPIEYWSNHYQNFFFDVKDFEKILSFFRGLRFPCPNADPMGYEK